MEEQILDANPASQAESASESSELAAALKNVGQPRQEAQPASSAETLNTAQAGSNVDGGDQQVPWHKDPRWSKWQEDQKKWSEESEQLKNEAKYASAWKQAMASNPEFAKHVTDFINGNVSKNVNVQQDPQQEQLARAAELLMQAPQFKQLLDKTSFLEKTLQEKELNNVANDYKSTFKNLISESKIEIDPWHQKKFNDEVWDLMYKYDPQTLENTQFNPQLMQRAFTEVKREYESMINRVNSKFSKDALTNTMPNTLTNGRAPLTQPAKTEKEEINDFASQLKSLPK